MRMVNRRARYVWSCLCCLLLLMQGACGAPTATPPPSSVNSNPGSAVNPAPQLRGDITFLVGEDPEGLQGYKDVIAAFNKIHPAVKVTLTNIPDSNDFLRRLAADFAAKTPPDVFTINYRRFGQFAIKGALEPVEEYLAKSQRLGAGDFYPIALEAFKFKGKQYCLPQNFSSLQIYYNKKLFAEANVPLPPPAWTWDEFVKTARALTKDANGDGKIDQYGAGIAPQLIRLAPFIWARGGELVDDADKPTRLMLDSGPALEAFKWFVELQTKERVTPSKADEASESAQVRFQKGTLAMLFQSRVATPELRRTIKDFEWDVAPLPGDLQTVTILHSDGYCLTSGSGQKALTWAFVEFAAGAEGQKIMTTMGRTVPSLKSVAASPAFLNPQAPPLNSRLYLDAAPQIRRLPVMTTWLEVEDVVNKEIRRAFYGDATVEEAARSAVQSTLGYFQQNLKDLDGR